MTLVPHLMTEWNAERYHQVSSPQQAWGRRVLERLPLEGHEHVLDIGCGTGRITGEIAARVPAGRVVGVDRSAAMLETAALWLAGHAPAVQARHGRRGGTAVPSRIRRSLQRRDVPLALRPRRAVPINHHGASPRRTAGRAVRRRGKPRAAPGPRLDADAGLPLCVDFGGWADPTYFADVAVTTRRLTAAGFVDVDVSLEAAPTPFDTPDAFQEFIANVCVRHHLARLPARDRPSFLRELTLSAAGDDPPLTLDYWRLNISARRPA